MTIQEISGPVDPGNLRGTLNDLIVQINAAVGVGGGGVTSLQSLTGAVGITSAGSTITITESGQNINLESSGGQTTVKVSGATEGSSMSFSANAIADTLAIHNTSANTPIGALAICNIPGYTGTAANLVEKFHPTNLNYFTTNVVGTYANGTAGVGAALTTVSTALNDTGGSALVNGHVCMLTGQTSAFQNGYYTVSGVGTAIVFTRVSGFDVSANYNPGNFIVGAGTTFLMFVYNGIANPTIGTDALPFVVTKSAAYSATVTAINQISMLYGNQSIMGLSFYPGPPTIYDPSNPTTLYFVFQGSAAGTPGSWNGSVITFTMNYHTQLV